MTAIHLQTIIPADMAGQRLDRALAHLFTDYSRSRIQQWIKQQQVHVNGALMVGKEKVHGGEQVEIRAETRIETEYQAQAIDLAIIYEDDTILVINKPVGLVVHPAAGNWENTLLNALLHHHPALQELPRAGIVHRLDKDTSGLLVIAKTLSAHTHLVKQLQARHVKREYLALVNGYVTAGGEVRQAIGRHPVQRKRMAVVHNGKPAITHYRIAERFANFTLLRVNLETGRTHQIRVHMAHVQHPLVGDQTYAGRLRLPKAASQRLRDTLQQFKRQALHAHKLGLQHPLDEHYCEWQAPLPPDMLHLLETLTEEDKYDPHHSR